MAGSEVGLTGTATATITIADKNDHAPEFTHPLVRNIHEWCTAGCLFKELIHLGISALFMWDMVKILIFFPYIVTQWLQIIHRPCFKCFDLWTFSHYTEAQIAKNSCSLLSRQIDTERPYICPPALSWGTKCFDDSADIVRLGLVSQRLLLESIGFISCLHVWMFMRVAVRFLSSGCSLEALLLAGI